MLRELHLTDEELIRNAHLFVSHDSAVVTAFGHRILTLIDAPDIARAALAADTNTAVRETLRVLGDAATGVDKLQTELKELCTSVDSQIAQLAAVLLGRPAATPTCEIHPSPPVWQPPALTHDIPARFFVTRVEAHTWVDPLTACADLGQEFLISTPSHADFSIAADVFIDRLRAYARAGQPILEPDFVLALGRLRIHDADQVARQVVGVRVPLYPDPGVDAGQLAAAYAHDPFRDPGMRGCYGKDVEYPASLSVLPNRWAGNSYDHRAFPRFADSAFCRFLHDPEGLEGVAFAGSPLPAPALAALFRSSANQETIEAAWRRGLVWEGNIDAALFDATTLSHVITLCYRLAQKGMAGFVIKLLSELSQCFPVQEVADALVNVRRCVEQGRK
ncbi:hypothetical protein CMUST_10115 [Corynebacterium mustelae]|uniref:DUF7824 domain-containing protein n=1 Tax=Corynebacterium mustelae TaxID=571915 RepID=A0A0G3GYU8_9CORY|nr:DUF6493 family protein [Corynebacterium mustelae]AKK06339.1 hypothetical protein CMUST_10115 [Corynebacterium mustelae]